MESGRQQSHRFLVSVAKECDSSRGRAFVKGSTMDSTLTYASSVLPCVKQVRALQCPVTISCQFPLGSYRERRAVLTSGAGFQPLLA